MKRFLTICASSFAVLALSGAALADNGGGNGNNGTPPGQTGNPGNGNPNPGQGNPAQPAGNPAQPAGNAAQPAAAGNGQSEEKQAEHKKAKPATPAKKGHDGSPGKSEAAKSAAHGKSEAAQSASHGKSAEAQHKVIICHATGSESNPYVVINISVRGWLNGHKAHHADDKLLKDPASPGEKGPDKSACGQPAAPAAQQSTQQQSSTTTTTTACPATGTRTEQVLVGIDHATGSEKNPFVRISPSESSAHLDKHEDDRAVYETRTIVVATGETCSTATTTGAATTAAIGASVAGTAATTATVAAAIAAIAAIGAEAELLKEAGVPNADEVLGGVAGVSATIPAKKPKAKGGVLGVSKTLGTAAVRRDLPFTGLPLWIAALIGAGLLATGLTVRARSRA